MSYLCAACNEVHIGKKMVLVPSLKRRVSYRKVAKDLSRGANEGDTVFVGDPYQGWEASKEAKVCPEKADAFKAVSENSFESDLKNVFFMVPNKPKVWVKSKNDNDEED